PARPDVSMEMGMLPRMPALKMASRHRQADNAGAGRGAIPPATGTASGVNLRAGWRDKVCMHPSGGETVRIKARLRSFYLAALAAATLASAASHAAGMPGCGDVAGDWDGWIAGCAVIIDDTRE